MTATVTVHGAVHACVTDLGRFGLAHVGVPTNGVADRRSARTANILVGNLDDAPLVQVTATDFSFVVDAPTLVAVTGASAYATVDGAPTSMWTPIHVPAGAQVRVAGIHAGMHTYVALNGTLAAPRFRGSAAPDLLLGFGLWLGPGSEIELATRYRPTPHPFLPQALYRFPVPVPHFADRSTLDVLPGPEAGQFGDSAAQLVSAEFVVGHRSDQVGTRLQGPVFTRSVRTEILSRGVPLGAVEVPPAGELIALQRGRPVTAGYPVIAVVARASRDRLGQLRPADRVRFREVTHEEARASYLDQEHGLDLLRRRVHTSFGALGIPVAHSPDIADLPVSVASLPA